MNRSLLRRVVGPLALVLLGVAALANFVGLAKMPQPRAVVRYAPFLALGGLYALGTLAPAELHAVEGRIVRSDTGQPIDGAHVVAKYSRSGQDRPSAVNTDDRGEFTVYTTCPWGKGDAPLEVTAPGYYKKVAAGGDDPGYRTITLIPLAR